MSSVPGGEGRGSGTSRWTILLGTAAIALLLVLDPYAFGQVGGDVHITVFEWQRVLSTLLGVLVAMIACAVLLKRYRAAIALLLFEGLLYLGANLFYLYRDGFSRFVVGYESFPLTLGVVLAGLVLRALLVVVAFGLVTHPPSR
jgi:hypothetical protein